MENKNDLNFQIEIRIAKIKEINNKYEELINTCKSMVKRYNEKIQNYENKKNKETEYVEMEIKAMIGKEEMRETKTMYKYNIPSGEISIKKEKEQIKKPDNSIMNEIPKDYLVEKTTKQIDWTRFKKELRIENEKIIHISTGEIVDYLEIEKVPESKLIFKIEDVE